MRRAVTAALGMAATLALATGAVALAIVAFPLADYRPPGAARPRDELVAVVARTTRRSTAAVVALDWVPARHVVLGDAQGRVTAVYATADTPVRCGAAAIAVDGTAVRALCGDVPLRRDVDAATQGPDADAVADLLNAATSVVRPSDVIWIGQEFTPTSVLVRVGDWVARDTAVFAVDASLRSATVAGTTTDATARVFVADGTAVEFALSTAGTLDAGAFEEVVRALSEPSEADLPLRLQGSVRLAAPISLAGIPPSALVTAADGSTCVVLASGQTTDVKIVDSVIGIVMVDADLPEGTLIRNLPPAGTAC